MSEEGNDKSVAMTNAKLITTNLPAFNPTNLKVWFSQVELYFQCNKVEEQDTMFACVAAQLPVEIAAKVGEILESKPHEKPYDTLKEAILQRIAPSEEARMEQLLSGVELKERTPSQLLGHMRSLIGTMKINDDRLRKFWYDCLPSNVKLMLSSQEPNTPLDKLAEAADKMHNEQVNTSGPSTLAGIYATLKTLRSDVSAVRKDLHALINSKSRCRSRSSSRQSRSSSYRDVCFYHRRFGSRARKCTVPCSF